MDPQARQATWDIVRELKRQGVTILLTTHFMDEAERLADRVAIIDQGRLVALGTPRALIEEQTAGPPQLRFASRPGLDLAALAEALGAPQVHEESPGEYEARIRPEPRRIAALASWLSSQNALLVELRLGNRTLEDVFLNLTGRDLRD
jgi:ABC-2 type transport system ATP-binding protein